LLGFVVAVGIRGVQGLQCVVRGAVPGDRVVLPWLGSPEGVPRTERLAAVDGRVVKVMAAFDVSWAPCFRADYSVRAHLHNLSGP
jgi:hypothetical protein